MPRTLLALTIWGPYIPAIWPAGLQLQRLANHLGCPSAHFAISTGAIITHCIGDRPSAKYVRLTSRQRLGSSIRQVKRTSSSIERTPALVPLRWHFPQTPARYRRSHLLQALLASLFRARHLVEMTARPPIVVFEARGLSTVSFCLSGHTTSRLARS